MDGRQWFRVLDSIEVYVSDGQRRSVVVQGLVGLSSIDDGDGKGRLVAGSGEDALL